MHLDVDGEEFEPPEARRDTEVTLGPGLLVAILIGLILLCGLCFGLGYTMGRHRPAQPAAASVQPGDDAEAPVLAGGSTSKPSATGPGAPQPQQQNAEDEAQPPAPGANSAATPQSAGAAAGSPPAGQPQMQVQPALPSQGNAPNPRSAPQVQPALSQSPGLMVQIAAISRVQDAQVLVDALRKRGYAVIARREPADGLIHVQIGPFPNRNQANVMCQKLLNDGYNAVVQP